MFRRPGKSPLDPPIQEEDTQSASGFGYQPPQREEEAPSLYEATNARLTSRADPFEQPIEESEPWKKETSSLPHPFENVAKEEPPETTLGEGVNFRGELSFERLLRIDGTFEGELLSSGKVVVGPTGKVKANLNLRSAYIEGEIEGNITVQEKLELRSHAVVHGDIIAKSLVVEEGVTLNGHVLIEKEKTQED